MLQQSFPFPSTIEPAALCRVRRAVADQPIPKYGVVTWRVQLVRTAEVKTCRLRLPVGGFMAWLRIKFGHLIGRGRILGGLRWQWQLRAAQNLGNDRGE